MAKKIPYGLTDYFIIWPEFEAGRGFSDLY